MYTQCTANVQVGKCRSRPTWVELVMGRVGHPALLVISKVEPISTPAGSIAPPCGQCKTNIRDKKRKNTFNLANNRSYNRPYYTKQPGNKLNTSTYTYLACILVVYFKCKQTHVVFSRANFKEFKMAPVAIKFVVTFSSQVNL
jgi:hypothetical protein